MLLKLKCCVWSSPSDGRQRGQIHNPSRSVQADASHPAHPGLQLPLPLLCPAAVQAAQPWVAAFCCDLSDLCRVTFSSNRIPKQKFPGISADALLGHRERFRDLFTRSVRTTTSIFFFFYHYVMKRAGLFFVFTCAFVCFRSLTQFFNRAREIEFFKSIIQIPDLPDVSGDEQRCTDWRFLADHRYFKKPDTPVPVLASTNFFCVKSC